MTLCQHNKLYNSKKNLSDELLLVDIVYYKNSYNLQIAIFL